MHFFYLYFLVISDFGDKEGIVKQLQDVAIYSNVNKRVVHKWCPFFADVHPPDKHEQQILLFRQTVQLMKEHQIPYVMSSGTLLGMQRHNNSFIRWDDDMDIAVQNKDVERVHQALKQSKILDVAKFYLGYKSFFKHTPPAPHNYPWKYPFVDIFDRKEFSTGALQSIPDNEIWGGKTSMWNGLVVPVPNDTETILAGLYGTSWKTKCTSTCWDHFKEKGKKCVTSLCKEVQECALHSPLLSVHTYPTNRFVNDLNIMITFFDNLAMKNDIRYSISYETYLGWLCTEKHIYYYKNVDLHVGQSDVHRLLNMQNVIRLGLNVHVPLLQETNYLVVMNNSTSLFGLRQRYTCNGKPTQTLEDSCAFNGPFARVIRKTASGRVLHMNIFLFLHASHTRLQLLQQENHVQNIYGNVPVHVQNGYGSELPPLRRCSLSGVHTQCFDESYGVQFIKQKYGNNFITLID